MSEITVMRHLLPVTLRHLLPWENCPLVPAFLAGARPIGWLGPKIIWKALLRRRGCSLVVALNQSAEPVDYLWMVVRDISVLIRIGYSSRQRIAAVSERSNQTQKANNLGDQIQLRNPDQWISNSSDNLKRRPGHLQTL